MNKLTFDDPQLPILPPTALLQDRMAVSEKEKDIVYLEDGAKLGSDEPTAEGVFDKKLEKRTL